MEGCNAFIADCVVISCCCQCLILQLVLFLLLELPRRMARKTREYAQKKLRQRRKKGRPGETDLDGARGHEERGETSGLDVGKRILELEGIEVMNKVHGRGQCMEEVEKVLEELSMKGEFAFGSFWGRNNLERGRVMSCSKCVMSKEDLKEYGCHVVNFQLIELVEPG